MAEQVRSANDDHHLADVLRRFLIDPTMELEVDTEDPAITICGFVSLNNDQMDAIQRVIEEADSAGT